MKKFILAGLICLLSSSWAWGQDYIPQTVHRYYVSDTTLFQPRRPWKAAAETFGLNMLVWGFDRFIMKEEWSYINGHTIKSNFDVVQKMKELKLKKLDKEISEDEFKKQASEIKGSKDAPVVLIKATDDASYRNLVDALDEMQICNIGKYAIVDITDGDKFLVDNLKSGGELTKQIARSNPKK